MLNRWAAWPRGTRWAAGGIAAAVLGLAIVWVLFVPAADWLAHHDVGSAAGLLHETALDNARGRLLTLGAGLLAAGALWFTARNFLLSREGQVTDRYTRAIEQLGSDKIDVRIGGIYALERVARDSARDHTVVMEVLAAFIREHSHEPWPGPRTRPDVEAALTVVGRRDTQRDLRRIDLYGAALKAVRLPDADLSGTDLMEVNLSASDLLRARFIRADLSDAKLDGAWLHGADFTGADLCSADLRADIEDATFAGADLRRARWDEDIEVPEGWKLDTTGRLERAGDDTEPP